MNLYKDGGYLRKLIFTLSSVNAVLNALVIAIFMEPEIIVLYKPDGTPGIMGSRWWYLVYVALPVLVSALFSIKVIAKEKANAKQNKDQSSDPIEEILYGKLPHNYNTLMMIVWILAIISWIMTGIALNNIENISVILPSIIVIMLSAVTVFITSIYNSAAPNSVCGIKLPEGLKECAKLPEPIYTPSTKADLGDHDENISFEQSVAYLEERFPGKGQEYAEKLRDLTIALYKKCADYALEKGIIIADTKFEFGLDENGNIVLGDEMLTPDSSRFWPLDGYEPGKSQPSFDKQLARDYISSHPECNYTLPQEIVDQTIAIYLDGYRRLTGEELK